MQSWQSPSAGVGAAEPGSTEYQRERLAAAMPLSTHSLNRGALFSRAAKRGCWAGLLFLICVPSLAATITMLKQDRIDSAICGGLFTAMFFLLGLWLVSAAINVYSNAVTE